MHEFVRLAYRRAEFAAPGLTVLQDPTRFQAAGCRTQASWARTVFFDFAGDVLEAFAISCR